MLQKLKFNHFSREKKKRTPQVFYDVRYTCKAAEFEVRSTNLHEACLYLIEKFPQFLAQNYTKV